MGKNMQIPISINREKWNYWGEAKIFPGCFSDWSTLEEYWDNMTEAIWDYISGVNEWFFEMDNTWILNINIDSDGRIKNNFVKTINQSSYKALSWS